MNEFFKKPVVKILMLKGEKGDKGNTGTGIPTGGKTGQYLLKKSDADYDYVWSPITTVSWDNVSGKTNATAATAGLMSAEDKSKLDGIASGATKNVSTVKSFTLSASSWEDNGSWIKYDIADSLVTSNSNQEVIPNGAIISSEQFKALQRACLVGTQEQGIIHLWAYGKKPTIDIPIMIIFRGTI